MLFNTSLGVNSGDAKQVVKCVAGGAITAGKPVGIYQEISGSGTADDPYKLSMKCIIVAVDANTLQGKWGVTENGGSAGDIIDVVVHGRAKVASGGALNNLVTGISTAGALTDLAPANTNVDIALAVCLDADEIFIY